MCGIKQKTIKKQNKPIDTDVIIKDKEGKGVKYVVKEGN